VLAALPNLQLVSCRLGVKTGSLRTTGESDLSRRKDSLQRFTLWFSVVTETTPEAEQDPPVCPACSAVMSLEATFLGGLPELRI
jgi:hypothetical protein